ncbi:hypothetical protein RJ639_012374 [Escallonia herrerae]|uniref:Retrotransposon gag domain-containing protein n=1 Tax=Escallonia herrerae TaxID=1293975 RepID=A0AA89AQD7_9ASTE|nr:hypothetical protein RJ639_012374 [Escallonia herrerae]
MTQTPLNPHTHTETQSNKWVHLLDAGGVELAIFDMVSELVEGFALLLQVLRVFHSLNPFVPCLHFALIVQLQKGPKILRMGVKSGVPVHRTKRANGPQVGFYWALRTFFFSSSTGKSVLSLVTMPIFCVKRGASMTDLSETPWTTFRVDVKKVKAKNRMTKDKHSCNRPQLACAEDVDDDEPVIQSDLAKGVIHAKTAYQVWEDFKDQFSQKNAPAIYQIQKSLASFSQGTMTVSTYFTKLKGLWDELDTYRALPICNQMKTHDEQREEDRLMQFLMGLHDTYNIYCDRGGQGNRHNTSQQRQRGSQGNAFNSFHVANTTDSSQSTHGVHSQDTNSSPGLSTDQLQQLAQALSMMTQNQKSPGNSDAYANAARLGYGEDDWLGRDVKFSETIFPFMSAAHPTSTLPYISPYFKDNWQSSPSLPTNIPSSQPQPTDPTTIQESASSIQSPLAEPTAPEDISPNPTQPLTSSPPAQSAEPISTSPDSIIPSSPPPRQSLRPKQPPAWHRDYILYEAEAQP